MAKNINEKIVEMGRKIVELGHFNHENEIDASSIARLQTSTGTKSYISLSITVAQLREEMSHLPSDTVINYSNIKEALVFNHVRAESDEELEGRRAQYRRNAFIRWKNERDALNRTLDNLIAERDQEIERIRSLAGQFGFALVER